MFRCSLRASINRLRRSDANWVAEAWVSAVASISAGARKETAWPHSAASESNACIREEVVHIGAEFRAVEQDRRGLHLDDAQLGALVIQKVEEFIKRVRVALEQSLYGDFPARVPCSSRKLR